MGLMKDIRRKLYLTAPQKLGQWLSLDQIAVQRKTDKQAGRHGFTKWYEEQWAHLRDRPITLLEMGVKKGASLLMWHDYFPKARILGMDTEESCRSLEQDRIKIVIGSQADPELAKQIARDWPGGFDIILDDAGHFSDHMIAALDLYFPMVKPGGYYALEDLHASYDENYRNGAPVSIVDHLKGRIDEMNLHGKLVWADKPPEPTPQEAARRTLFETDVEMMAFYRSMVVIRRKAAK